MALLSKHIFIDTCIFEANNFMHGRDLKTLCQFARENYIHLYITDIVVKEIHERIIKGLAKARAESRKFVKEINKNNQIVENTTLSPILSLLNNYDYNAAKKKLIEEVNGLIKDSNIEILGTGKVSIREIFNKYFDNKPPFKEGNKKHEFPDAFTLQALEGYFTKLGQKVYILSTDNDLLTYSHPLFVPEKEIAKLIDLVIKDKEKTHTIQKLEKEVLRNKKMLLRSFENWFTKKMYIDTGEADLLDINLLNKNFKKLYTVSFEPDAVVFKVDVEAQIEATLQYSDYSTGYYDKEDEKWYFVETRQKTKEVEEAISCDIQVSNVHEFLKANDQLEISLSPPEDYYLSLDFEDFGYPERYM